jgi:hypothetical protein
MTRIDQNKSIRVVVRATVSTPLERNIAAAFVTDPTEVLNDDPILRRLASTLKRSGKTNFDAKLLTGEEIVVINWQAQSKLPIRHGIAIIFKSTIRDVDLGWPVRQTRISDRAQHRAKEDAWRDGFLPATGSRPLHRICRSLQDSGGSCSETRQGQEHVHSSLHRAFSVELSTDKIVNSIRFVYPLHPANRNEWASTFARPAFERNSIKPV